MAGAATAVDQLSSHLLETDAELYLFKPADVEEKYFIDAGFVAGAAAILCVGFVSGFVDGLKGHVEVVGKQAGDWVGKKLEGLFRGEPAPSQQDVDRAASDASALAAATTAELAERAAAQTRQALSEAFQARGALPSNADAIADAVERAVRPLLVSA